MCVPFLIEILFRAKNLYMKLNNDLGLMSLFVGSLFKIYMPIDQVVIGFPNDLLKSIQSYNDFSNSVLVILLIGDP